MDSVRNAMVIITNPPRRNRMYINGSNLSNITDIPPDLSSYNTLTKEVFIVFCIRAKNTGGVRDMLPFA